MHVRCLSCSVLLFILTLFVFVLVEFGVFIVGGMDQHLEQRTNIKFMSQSGKSLTKIWRCLQQVYGGSALSYPQVHTWQKRFQQGRAEVKDNPCSGCPATRLRHITAVRNSLQQDSRKTVQEISSEIGAAPSTVFKVIKKDLNMKKLSPKFIPHLLSNQQKAFRVARCLENLDLVHTVPWFLDRIVTGDETWVSVFHQETKFESCQWLTKGSGRPMKAVKSNSVRKTMLILFHDSYGVILLEFLPRGKTVDADFYCDVLRRLKEQIRHKRPGLWQRDEEGYRTVLLHHDNATPHTAMPTLALLGESGINIVTHPTPPLQS